MIGGPGTGDARPGPAGPGGSASQDEPAHPVQVAFEQFLSLTRLLVLIPVVFLLIDAAASFIYGTDILVRSATGLVGAPSKVGSRLGVFLVVMDTFLVGATLMVAAFGFYELFVARNKPRGRRSWLPAWLRMNDLEDLKGRVVSMLILVAAITFVDHAVETHNEEEVLFLGLAVSVIIVALTFFLWWGKRNGSAPGLDAVVVAGGRGPTSGGTADGPASTASGGTDNTLSDGPVVGNAESGGPAGREGVSKGYERTTGMHRDRPVSQRDRYCATRPSGSWRTVSSRKRHGGHGTTP